MKPAVVLSNLDLFYGDRRVLHDVSFTVDEGDFFIIIGPNGSGKTTLVKAIAGLAKSRSGSVEISGHPIESLSGRELAHRVAVVPQFPPSDISFTVAELVIMGRSPYLGLFGLERSEDFEIAREAMSFTRVDHLAKRKLDQLSAGERQRVLIARAICQQARIVVLDEPTASLDLAHQIRTMDLMEKLRSEENVTVIMVSHDLNLAALYGNRLLLMNGGKTISLGTPHQVLTYETLERVYGCVLLVDENPLKKVPRVTQVPKAFLHKVALENGETVVKG